MYDEINNDNIEGNGFTIEPSPEDVIDGSIQDEPLEPVMTQPESESGFYHYSYDRNAQCDDGCDNGYQQTNYSGSDGTPPGDVPFYGSSKPPKKNNGGGTWRKFALCAGLAIVFGVVASAAFQVTDYIGASMAPKETEAKIEKTEVAEVIETEQKAEAESNQTVTNASVFTDVSQVAENTMPSIVAITNKGVEEIQGLFYGQSYKQETESAGSGVIIAQNDTELLIATNNHVVEGAEELSVCFTIETEDPEDSVVEAQVKGTDPEHDLAIVAVALSDISADVKGKIKVAQIGDSENLKVGQQVVAIGNALGYGQSVTVGYISALDREVTVEDGSSSVTNNLIQTDAAINFGNSGGALLNASGQLIGINSVKAAASGVEGMGYAIPMKTAEPILNELMNRTTRQKVDTAEKGYMGITPEDVSEEARQVYSMPAGAFVYEVSEGSAAAKAGIVKGDIIVKIDGITVTSKAELFSRMDYYKAGETIEIVVAAAEGGEYKERTVSVTLGERPAEAQVQETEAQDERYEGEDGFPFDEEDFEGYFSFPR